MNEKSVNTGICNAHCPVFKVTNKQRYSPRGFLHLIQENISHECIYTCTLCGHCEEDNPLPVDFLKYFRAARAKAVEEGKEIPAFKRMVDNLKRTGNIYGMD